MCVFTFIHGLYIHGVILYILYIHNLFNENLLSARPVRGQGIAMLILTFSQKTSNEG